MAYQKLFGVALLLSGAIGVGCSNGRGNVAYDVADDPAPGNGDQPPASSDRPPGNPDRVPSDSERPPSNPDAPSNAGQLQGLCDKLCEVVDRCGSAGGGMEGMDTQALCDAGRCALAANVQIPCASELVGLLDCALGLSNLCAADGSDEDDVNTAACRDAVDQYGSCQDSTDDPDPDPRPGDNPNPQKNCTTNGGCQNCLNACATCFCEATGDDDAVVACGTSAACTMP